jgi:hypothetical protein
MQYCMQEIYKKQQGLTPEEEHLISFFGSDNDEDVLEELHRRPYYKERADHTTQEAHEAKLLSRMASRWHG